MTDLIARLEELEKAATPNQMAFVPACKHDACQPNGGGCLPAALGWQEGDGAVNIFAFWNYMEGNGQPDKDAALIVELWDNRDAILHALKVLEAAEDACQEMTWAEFIGKKWPALVRAVRGEQP